MGSGPCSVGTAEKQIYSGLHTELPESVQSSCCCKTNQLLQSHFFFWAFPSPGSHGTVVCTELPWRSVVALWQLPIVVGVPGWDSCSKGWGVQVGVGCCPGLGLFSLLAVLGGFASSQICSPGGTNPGCCTELRESSYQKCQLCDMCCGTAESCFHCCLALCQHYFWKAV